MRNATRARRRRFLTTLLTLITASAAAYAGTVTGTLMGPSGLPVKNGTLDFVLQQAGLIAGSGSVVPTTAYCYTSADGTVTGLPNPLRLPQASISYGSGSLPAGIYYVQFTIYTLNTGETLASPELVIQLTSSGTLTLQPPVSFPANGTGMKIYIGTSSGGEMLQASTPSQTAQYSQTTALAGGAAVPNSNSSPCTLVFNDTIIPYSGYNVALISSSGNAYPGWPQVWQLNGGPSGTVNISNGTPLWNGTIIYPQPIMAQPLNHGPQSISGHLNMTGYSLLNASAVGVNTSTPGWPLDVEGGPINTSLGYMVNGSGGSSGQCLVSNGTVFVPGTCGSSAPTVYYQHLQRNGQFFNQEPYSNFSTDFSLNDNAGSTRTEIGLEATAVTAGSYTNANITVDANGRIQGATSGPTIPVIKPLIINSGICTTGTGAAANCTFSVSWPTAFADNNYALSCSPNNGGIGGLTALMWGNKTATGFTLSLQNGTASMAVATTLTEIDCIGMHP